MRYVITPLLLFIGIVLFLSGSNASTMFPNEIGPLVIEWIGLIVGGCSFGVLIAEIVMFIRRYKR